MRVHPVFPAVCALAVLLVSCGPPQSENPASDPKTAAHDKSLSGLWRMKNEDGETGYVHFIPAENGWMDIVMVGQKRTGADVSQLKMFSSKLGDRRYMNLQEGKSEKPPKTGFLIARYEIKDKALEIALLEEAPVAAAIREGKIKGTVAPAEAKSDSKGLESVLITDSTENIGKLLATPESDKLFGKPLKLERTGD